MSKTTQSKLAEQAMRKNAGGNISDDYRFDIREVVLMVRQVFAGVMRIRYFQNKAEDNSDINGDLIYSFKNIEVKEESDTGRLYSDIPRGSIDLPNGVVVRHISPMKELNKPFVPVANSFSSLYRGLGAANLQGRIGFYLENGKAFYENLCPKDQLKEVFVKVVLPLDSIDEDDEINIPDDIQLEVVTRVVEMMQPTNPKDNTNDSRDINGQ